MRLGTEIEDLVNMLEKAEKKYFLFCYYFL